MYTYLSPAWKNGIRLASPLLKRKSPGISINRGKDSRLCTTEFYYIKQSDLLIFPPLIKLIDNLTCVIIHDNLTCVDYHDMHQSLLLYFCGAIGLFFYIINRTKLFLVLNRISHSFALLTREISWSTLEIFRTYSTVCINLSSPRSAKTGPFVILLCLTPDDFTCQWRVSGWERVKFSLYI